MDVTGDDGAVLTPLGPVPELEGAKSDFKKTIKWRDGFVLVGFGMCGFMIISIGPAIAALGALPTAFAFGASVVLGAIQARVLTELAVAHPDKSGGLGIYANEGFRVYRGLKWVGPLATFGYWFAWSSSMGVELLLAGQYVQATILPGLDPRVFATIGLFALWIANLLGLRPGVWIGYAFGTLTVIPLTLLILFSIPHIHLSFLTEVPGHTNFLSVAGLGLLLFWGFIAGYGTYSAEVNATLAPEFHDTEKDTPKAIMASAIFAIPYYILVPIALTGVVGVSVISTQTYTAFVPVFQSVIGNGATAVVVTMLVAALVLGADIGTIDGSRALNQMSRDHLTIKFLGHLNRRGVPDRAMSVDLLLNLLLVWLFGQPLFIVVAGNLGYFLGWIACLIAFLLLRRHSPNLRRPIKLRNYWIPIVWGLIIINTLMVVFGAPQYGWVPLLAGAGVLVLSLVLFFIRTKVEDRPIAPSHPQQSTL